MHYPIHDYIIKLSAELKPNRGKLLDYGCGAGEIVCIARESGFDSYGVDIFYSGGSTLRQVKEKNLYGTFIFEINNNIIPFPDNHFDIIVSNQVFEHIDDFTLPLDEIARVLKSDGVCINLFPSREVMA